MTPTETVLQAIQRLEGEKRRLERAMRDALENQSPAHAERYLREGLK